MKNPVMAAHRLKALRERAGVPMAEVAKALGFRGSSSYQRYEDANLFTKRYLPLEMAEKLARILRGRGDPAITEAEVLALAGKEPAPRQRMIPVVGYVGAGAAIHAIDDHAKGAGLDEVECPWDELGPDTVAVRVRGESMAPVFLDGDLIFYESRSEDFAHLVGRDCVIGLMDGRRFVKQLRRTADGHYYLHSHNAEPIFGVGIAWAAKIRLLWRAN